MDRGVGRVWKPAPSRACIASIRTRDGDEGNKPDLKILTIWIKTKGQRAIRILEVRNVIAAAVNFYLSAGLYQNPIKVDGAGGEHKILFFWITLKNCNSLVSNYSLRCRNNWVYNYILKTFTKPHVLTKKCNKNKICVSICNYWHWNFHDNR